MRIIIEIKETATLSRIADFGRDLEALKHTSKVTEKGYDDIIADIHKEW